MPSLKGFAVGAALAVLALTVTINVAVSTSPPSAASGKENETGIDFMLQLLNAGNIPEFERLMETPVASAFNAQDTNVNSSVKESLNEGVEVSPSDDEFGWVEFSPEDTEKQELMIAHQHRARSLTRLTALHCKAEDYSLVTIIDGTYVQIMSPGYPSAYPSSIRCGWKILTDPGLIIRILCPVYKLGRGDFTLVKDYGNQTTLRFNASSPMKNVTTVSNKMFLGFKSDSDGEGSGGFLCLVRSLPNPQHVKSVSPAENATDPTELEVPDFKKRSGQPFKGKANTTTENVTVTVGNASKVQVTAAPALSSESLLVSSSDVPRTQSVITGEYLQALKQKAIEEGLQHTSVWINKPYAQVNKIKTYTVRSGSTTYVTNVNQ